MVPRRKPGSTSFRPGIGHSPFYRYLTVIFASQLLQAAKGLQYLHTVGVLHGTLEAASFFFFFCLLQSTTGQLIFGAVLFSANVLINGSAGIWIADHGLFQYRRERDDSDFWTCWDATELSHTTIAFKPADIFAFAMLVVEVFTGQESFGSSMFDIDALLRIGNRKRPVDVQGFTNAIWDLVQRSWAQDPDERRLPTMWSRRGSG